MDNTVVIWERWGLGEGGREYRGINDKGKYNKR